MVINTILRITNSKTYQHHAADSFIQKADRSSASHETPLILWTSKVHGRLQNSLSLVPILSYISPVHAVPTNFFTIHLILPSHLFLGLPSGFYPPSFTTETLYAPLFSLVRGHMH